MSTLTIPAPGAPAASTGANGTPAGAQSIGASLYPDHSDPGHPIDNAVEFRKPASSALDGYWTAELRDAYGVEPRTILSVEDPFVVAFHVWLSGDLWRCICGDWCFDMCFESLGGGTEFCLSDLPEVAPQLMLTDWVGCKSGALHFWVVVTCGAGTVPAPPKNRLYRVGATFQMLDPCGRPASVVGYHSLGEFQFYTPR